MKPYYEGVSAYTEGPWKDSFIGNILDGTIDSNGTGALLGMPTGVVTVNLFYNTELLAASGIEPNSLLSWSGVLDAAKTIASKNNGVIPMSIQNSINWNLSWMEHFMMEQLWFDVVPTLDIIDANGKLETPELALGIKSGVIKLDDQRMIDYYTFLKEMSKYFNEGFNTASWEYEALFNEGKAAMNLNGSWFPNQYKQNKLTVEYGTMPIPYVDSKISAKAENRLRKYSIGLGGPDMIVTKKAFDEGRGDAAVDFLQFFSDPQTGAKMVAEQFMWIPVVKDVQVPDELKGITEYIGDDMQMVGWGSLIGMNAEAQDKYLVLRANFLDDASITPQEMAAEVKKLYDAAADQAIEDNPDWKIETYLDKVK
jgi:raffinose/stachyose/melibiose transport system substrate-binding protein